MKTIVFLAEEPSMVNFLRGFVPRYMDENKIRTPELLYIPHQGKSDLKKSIPKKLKGWVKPNTYFMILHDKDSNDCIRLKEELMQICNESGRPDTIVRIVCTELESWYLGDDMCLKSCFGIDPSTYNQKAKFRNPDLLSNPYQELKKIAPKYQKLSGSEDIGRVISLSNNRSNSFNVFITGLEKLLISRNNGRN